MKHAITAPYLFAPEPLMHRKGALLRERTSSFPYGLANLLPHSLKSLSRVFCRFLCPFADSLDGLFCRLPRRDTGFLESLSYFLPASRKLPSAKDRKQKLTKIRKTVIILLVTAAPLH
jgi:hypothetical protein